MSPQDSQMLHDFLSQLIQARGIQKDPEADALIQRAVAQQPDAAYLLVQRSLLQEQAINNARERINALENQLRSGQRGDDGKFLDANSWGNSGGSRPAQAPAQYQRDYQQPNQAPYQAQYQQPPYPNQQYQQPSSGGFLRGAGGGMLGTIAATAAGVAAGNFLFHGLDNMFHDHGGSGGGGGNHLLNSDDTSNNLFTDQSGSGLADQAGLGDIGQSLDSGSGQGLFDQAGLGDVGQSLDNGSSGQGLFDSGVDDGSSLDSSGGFFDGDGSDEGLFS